MTQSPTTIICYCTFGTVTTAQLGVFASRCTTVSVTNMSLGEVEWINHFDIVPTAKDNMKVLWQFADDINMAIYDVILLCEAQDFTVSIGTSDVDHMLKVCIVRDVSRHMESKKSRHHN